jgi:hypothetical protein
MKKIFLHILLLILVSLPSFIYAQSLKDVKIGIVYSEKTKEVLYPQNKEFYPIQDWELFFLNRKISYTVINDEQLDDNDFDFLDILILPSVEILSESAAENLQEFLDDGKGLLIFGKIGLYDEKGRKNVTGFLKKSGGFKIKEVDTKDEIAERHTLPASSAICRNINSVNSLLILNQYKPLVAETASKDIEVIGEYLFDKGNDKQYTNSGIVLSERNNGRIVWFGFQLSQILSDRSQEVIVEKLIFNSIVLLSPTPILMFGISPKQKTVPVIISNFIFDAKSISSETLEQLYLNDIRANFFIDANEVESSANGLSKFAVAGDINIYFDSQLSKQEMRSSELEILYDKLKINSRQKYIGLYLNNSDLIQSSDNFSVSPFNFFTLPDNSLYILNDNNGFKKMFGESSSFQIEEDSNEKTLQSFSAFYNNALKNKEVAYVNFIEQTNSKIDFNNSNFRIIIDYLKNQNAWITTYSDLIKWELMRSNLIVTTKRMVDEDEFEVTIENRSQYEVKNTELQLIEPAGMYNPKLSQSNLQLNYDPVFKTFSIPIPFMRAGTKEIFNLTFDDRR